MNLLQVVDNKSAKVTKALEMITLQYVQLYAEENQRKTTRQVMVEYLGYCFLAAEKKNYNCNWSGKYLKWDLNNQDHEGSSAEPILTFFPPKQIWYVF